MKPIILSALTFLFLFDFPVAAEEYSDVISSTPGLVAQWSFEEQVATGSGRQGLRMPDFRDITPGSNQFGSNYTGSIDEFAYYREALTRKEIKKHCQQV